MPTDASFAEYVVDQAARLPGVRTRKMFGEYALYVGGKTVAFLCDNQVFLKDTPAGRALIPNPLFGPPYPGAKDYLVVDEALDDRDQFITLLRTTAEALPEPKVKKPSSSRPSGSSRRRSAE